jgi:hypothetical protein
MKALQELDRISLMVLVLLMDGVNAIISIKRLGCLVQCDLFTNSIFAGDER